MHGVGAEALVDDMGPDDFRGDAGVDVVLGETPRRVFGQPQFADPALRIGERRRHRMPAIEDRTVRPLAALAPSRLAGGLAGLGKSGWGSAFETRLVFTLAHARIIYRHSRAREERAPNEDEFQKGQFRALRQIYLLPRLVDFAGPIPS